MALVTVGTITVDFNDPSPQPFPSVNLASGTGYVFYLEAVPVSQRIEYGYLIPCPTLVVGGLIIELACRYKWYPKGIRYGFVVPIFEAGGFNLDVVVALIPVQVFKGRAKPQNFSATLIYENALTQPIAFGL